MNVIFTDCKYCGHVEVCSLKDQFKVVTDKINLDIQQKDPNSELSGLSYIKISITCSYFHKNGVTFRNLDGVK